jgi:cytochrome oxidase Cu insertion factor (SCO1/SenC/PrrC family)
MTNPNSRSPTGRHDHPPRAPADRGRRRPLRPSSNAPETKSRARRSSDRDCRRDGVPTRAQAAQGLAVAPGRLHTARQGPVRFRAAALIDPAGVCRVSRDWPSKCVSRASDWIKRGSVLALFVVAMAAGAFTAVARADGDPASDYLTTKQVFVTSQSGPESVSARRLLEVVGAANREGFAIRVAVISTDYDLGSITELWRKPRIYARFLGIELSLTYRERLLVVMPNGFGINWPNHSTAAAYGLLSQVRIAPGRAGTLAAAQTAVRRLAAADGFKAGSSTNSGSSPRMAATRHSDDRVLVFTAVTAALALVGVAVALSRRRMRPVVVGEQSGASAAGVPIRLRWAIPGLVVLLGLAVGIPVLAVGIFRHATAAPAVRLSSKPALPQVTWAPGRRAAPAFTLRDEVGRRVSLTAYRGRPVIVTFIDPLCRNFCPLTAQALNQVVSQMPASQRPEILAVSVDVYADTRADLLRDFREWQLVPQWQWAVGSPAQLANVWKHYEVGVSVITKHISGITIHYITHSEVAFIIDPTGHMRALFLWPFNPRDVERVLRQIA